jgi:hypothetical protein
MRAAIRHGARVVQLKGSVSDNALIRELQYDTFGLEILHVDFARVSEHERVHVKVPLEVRGHHDPASAHGFVGAALSSVIWHWFKAGDEWKAEKVIDKVKDAVS